jgi:hypothetical protein
MGEAAREVIIERYSLERVTDQLEHLLLGLRGEHGP